MPKISQPDDAPAAAEPGPGAPGTPSPEEPDILPDSADESEGAAGSNHEIDPEALRDPPFRTPAPGEHLTAEELKDRI